ncbi:MAG: BamA/TamA family outer membrane protein [Phycisphaerales bacterium]|nr:BamA/TamA family outer membrane protein [Planctomycetota bacterium]MBL6997333.1 BamA/TamA family outer membrane protein [Phycisphaerales bacterium]
MSPLFAWSGDRFGARLDEHFISAIRFERLDRVEEQRVQNLIQSAVGELYDPELVEGDVHILTHLGVFENIKAEVILQEDETIELVFTFTEQQIITQVSVVGNTQISDKELSASLPVMEGLGRDQDAIDRGKRSIMDLYKAQGNYLVEVIPETIVYGKDFFTEEDGEHKKIPETVVLIYRIMEGPRVRVKGMLFSGNHSFTTKELAAEVDTSVSVPFFRRGELNEQILDADVQSLKSFYINRGFRDVRVSYTDPLSPNDKEASVVFLIEEGPQYTIGGISVEFITVGNLKPVFTVEQIRGLIPMKQGDVFRQFEMNDAVASINNAYGVLGRIINVEPKQQAIRRARKAMYGGSNSIELDSANAIPYHAEPGATIDVLFVISEGRPTKVGVVEIKGNSVTQDKVIRGRIGLKPGYPFNIEEANRSETRLMKTGLFNKVTMTIQPENSENPNVRDLLVEVDESQTGSLNFGLMAGSDSGLIGNISLNQRNFDVADWPESWSEFWQRKAFIGAGQKFSMAFQPGDEVFNYETSLTDPRFLDSDYSLGGSVGWRQREYDDYKQETLFSRATIGRRFGDIWYGRLSLSADRIKLTNFDDNVPLEIFNDRGPSTINSLGLSVTRTTLAPFIRPTEGSRISLNIDQFGIPSGDYTFTKTYLSATSYFAIDRDFLNRTSTLRVDSKIGYIFGGESPTFEKFYLGGRTFRGFDYRTISPKGTPRVAGGDPNVPVGGDWEFYLGAQYEFPVLDRFISMVAFCDSGTVVNSPSFDEYRVSVGAGIRLYIPQLGQAPLAFDFGFPIMKEEEDKKKVFSFSVQLPF